MKPNNLQNVSSAHIPPPHHHQHPHPPHHPYPPHVRSSMIRIQYDDEAMEKLYSVYGEATDFALDALERCPPEIKLTLAMALGLTIDLESYKACIQDSMRFPSPLLSEATTDILKQAAGEDNMDVMAQIYDACPPEQTLLAIAVASLVSK